VKERTHNIQRHRHTERDTHTHNETDTHTFLSSQSSGLSITV